MFFILSALSQYGHLNKTATRQGFSRSPLLFFSALEELIESDFSNTNEKMLLIVSKFFPNTERQPAVRIHQYAECIVPSYSDCTFRSHFCLTQQCRNFGGSFSSLSRDSKSASQRTTSSECCKATTYNNLQYVASVGNGYQHQKGAKVLLTT